MMNYIEFIEILKEEGFPFGDFGVGEKCAKILSVNPKSEAAKASFKDIEEKTKEKKGEEIIKYYFNRLLGGGIEISFQKRFCYSYRNKITGNWWEDTGICRIDDSAKNAIKGIAELDKAFGNFVDWETFSIDFRERRIEIFDPEKIITYRIYDEQFFEE